jgi:ElaB/YqjD/DUF883 family membrane-anchored ribosome-binding protein
MTAQAREELRPRDAESLGDGVAQLRESALEAESWLRERAMREPLLAMGVALAAGFVLGRLLSRRG